MEIEHYSEGRLKKEILAIISKHLDVNKYKVFFFGSRVDGSCNTYSDIDLGIIGPNRISSDAFLDIQEEIENLPILYKVDVVDFKRTSEDFRKIALKDSEVLNVKIRS